MSRPSFVFFQTVLHGDIQISKDDDTGLFDLTWMINSKDVNRRCGEICRFKLIATTRSQDVAVSVPIPRSK